MGWFGRAFLIRAAVVAVLFLVGGSVALWNGETSASRLEPGDCFEALTEAEISTVKEQECTEPHGGEVYATISGTAAGLDARCQAAFDEGLSEGTIVLVEFPDDARFSYLQGEDDHHCLIESPSGQLVGRVSRDFDRLFGN